ncbi:MAG: hypothetical protein M1832_006057 [Thelocarpon impressellum]|nr:MAG: hypothetical protein M1832_006057 [Thelocarpon impressellum]
MFCLRSWLPLLFIPTNASPAFILLFFISTYFLNRPCVYCSMLLLILFISSCHWSDHCFFDVHGNWFEPRHLSSPFPNPISSPASLSGGGNTTMPSMATEASSLAAAVAGAAVDEIKRRMGGGSSGARGEWTGIGVEWIRSLLGRREWRIPCVDVHIRL